jgi:hypothetical protein
MQSGGESPETREPHARARERYSTGSSRSVNATFFPSPVGPGCGEAGNEAYCGSGMRLSPLAASVDWIGPTARNASAAMVSVGLAVAEVGKVPEPSMNRL